MDTRVSDLNINIVDMIASANATTGHGEDLATCHTTADNRLCAAANGWAGRSAAALANRADIWNTRSTALVTRIAGHAAHLHSGACRYAANEIERGNDLAVLAIS